MPAHKQTHGPIAAMARLLAMVASWRRRRVGRRRARLHGFMHMSDRMLADIGVRRADIHAAMSGLMPAPHIARTHGGAPWTAQIHRLRTGRREALEALRGKDLSAAA